MNFMRAFIAEYLEQNGYSCCEVNFVQAAFKQQPANFVNNIGYNLMYEAIGYKLKDGMTWEKLLKEKHRMPNKKTPGYYEAQSYITGYWGTITTIPAPAYQKYLYDYFDRVKIYFDIISQSFFVRPFDKQQNYPPDEVADKRTAQKLQKVCYREKWSSPLYRDDLYEKYVYNPDYFMLNGIYYYKICHEPYVQKEHALPENASGFVEDFRISASKVLSPEEILDVMDKHNVSDIAAINLHPSALKKLFCEAGSIYFKTPPPVFYTGNVLELTTELKLGITKLAKATALGFQSIQNTLSDLSVQWIETYSGLCQQQINNFSPHLSLERREKQKNIQQYLDKCSDTLARPSQLASMLIGIMPEGHSLSTIFAVEDQYNEAVKKAASLTEKRIYERRTQMENTPTASEQKIMSIISERDSMIAKTRQIMQQGGNTVDEINKVITNINQQYCNTIVFTADMMCLADILNIMKEQKHILSLEDIQQLNKITQ